MKANKFSKKINTSNCSGGIKQAKSGNCSGGIAKRKSKKKEKKFRSSRTEEEEEDQKIPPFPMPVDSGNPWDFRQASVVSMKPEGKKGEAAAHRTCPGGHPLRLFRTPHDEFTCELCGDDKFVPVGSVLFGCRCCDWDACEAHTHTAVKKQELLREKQMNEAQSKPQATGTAVSKKGTWKVLRGMDKYKNEFMYLRHDATAVLVELPGHSTGIFTFRNGAGAQARFCSESGESALFQLSLPSVAKRLDDGEGKSLAKKTEAGNWTILTLDDGGVVVSNECRFMKTSRQNGPAPVSVLPAQGLEVHLTETGDLMWMAPESGADTLNDLSILISPHQPPNRMTRDEAIKWLGVEGGVDDGNYSEGGGKKGEEDDGEDDDDDEDDDT